MTIDDVINKAVELGIRFEVCGGRIRSCVDNKCPILAVYIKSRPSPRYISNRSYWQAAKEMGLRGEEADRLATAADYEDIPAELLAVREKLLALCK